MSIRRPGSTTVFGGLLLLLLGSLIAGVAVGETAIPPGQVAQVLLSRVGWAAAVPDPTLEAIVLVYRLPGAVALALVGAALSGAGVLFQGMLRNPLADPYALGTSGGAAVGAVLGMLTGARISFLGLGAVPLFAFAGAMAAMLLVMQLATVGGRLPMVTVLLAGFAVSTVLGACLTMLLQIGNLQQTTTVYRWMAGGGGVAGWREVSTAGPLILLGLASCAGLVRSLNAFSLGEDGAARVGVNVERDKRLTLAAGSFLTAVAVSLSGLVGFVGLVVPHAARLLVGPDHRRLLPAAALAGASFLTLCDLLARVLFPPGGLPVGVVTAFLGGPFFLYLLRKSRREYQW